MEALAGSRKTLDWEQRPFRELLRLSWPIMVSTISYSVMTLVDTLLVGHLGAAELAGVGLGGTTAFVLLCFSFGLLRGVKTLVAQAVGAGRREDSSALLGAAVLVALGIGLVTIVAGQGVAELLVHVSASAAAGEAARTYLRIRNLGAPMVLVYVALREVQYAQGDARSPMVATVVANIVNIALAVTLIFGLHMGVKGAAIATVVAHTVEMSVLALATGFRGRELRLATLEHLRAIWRIGLPTGLQFMLEVGAFGIMAAMISHLDERQMAAHQIALQVVHFSFLPAFAIGEAASVLAGQAVGADQDWLVLRVARQGAAAASAYTGFFTLVMSVGAPLIVAGFTGEPQLAAVAISLLHVAAFFQVFDGANVVARAVLRGAGDVRFSAVVGVTTSWALTPPLTWLLGYHWKLGARGGWLGLTCEIVLGTIILWIRLERRSWLPAAAASRRRLREDAPDTATAATTDLCCDAGA